MKTCMKCSVFRTAVILAVLTLCGVYAANAINDYPPCEQGPKRVVGKSTTMSRGKVIHLCGNLPEVGSKAPDAMLADVDLSDIALSSYRGKTIILNIFPSLDTPTCSNSVRRFNAMAAKNKGVHVLCISKDLPFAQKRFCVAEGIGNVEVLSGFRSDFGDLYGLRIEDGPMKGLYARAVVVVDPNGKVVYKQLVPEISNEPDYEAVLKFVKEHR